jgi:hypothetical protein
MTVERLENEMSADELDEWMEFYKLEPFGDEERMSDRRNGLLCTVVNNSGINGSSHYTSSFLFYKDDVNSASKINTEDMTEENIKSVQSAIFQIFTTK